MQTLSQLLDRINSIIWGNWLLIVLLGIGLLYTVLSGFIQVRRFPYIMRKTLLEPWKQKKAATKSGDDTSISSFQALCTAIASCVGSGNIVGVSTAVLARGLYSNEAGEGSAPVIHSAANVEHPVEQGITGVTEVFLDTFVICTISGLVLGVTDVLDSGLPGSILMIHAFSTVWAPLKYLVIISLLLFCTTTLMSQWYFGFVGLNYLFGSSIAKKFKYVFPLFCLIGAVTAIDIVWTIQDIALGLLTIPNLIALIILSPQVKKCSDEYWVKKRISS